MLKQQFQSRMAKISEWREDRMERRESVKEYEDILRGITQLCLLSIRILGKSAVKNGIGHDCSV